VGIRYRVEDQIKSWPVYRQVTGTDKLGRGEAAKSRASGRLAPRTKTADAVVTSVCPYCAVGCGQNVYVAGGRVTQIEGDPDSPSAGAACAPRDRRASSSPRARAAGTRCCTAGHSARNGRPSTSARPWT
jgi:Molybdopterin oxidoreductase Fe4S4 domain